MRKLALLFALLLAGCSQRDLRTVVRIIDGDTILLDGEERVRLIGIDTPETAHPNRPVECYGREASAFLRKIAQGRGVRLDFDQQRKDRYGRTLAYVYLKNGTFVNAAMLREGYAHAYTRFPFRHMEEFRRLEHRAREEGRGLWGPACAAE
jgi:micrococcal nuclease